MISFKDYMEMTGYMSYAPLGSSAPNINTTGGINSVWNGMGTNQDLTRPQAYIQNYGLDYEPSSSDFDIPVSKTVRKSEIYQVDEKPSGQKGNVIISLRDGTTLYVPWGVYRKNKKFLKEGQKITVAFQRRSEDESREPSQIHSISIG